MAVVVRLTTRQGAIHGYRLGPDLRLTPPCSHVRPRARVSQQCMPWRTRVALHIGFYRVSRHSRSITTILKALNIMVRILVFEDNALDLPAGKKFIVENGRKLASCSSGHFLGPINRALRFFWVWRPEYDIRPFVPYNLTLLSRL